MAESLLIGVHVKPDRRGSIVYRFVSESNTANSGDKITTWLTFLTSQERLFLLHIA